MAKVKLIPKNTSQIGIAVSFMVFLFSFSFADINKPDQQESSINLTSRITQIDFHRSVNDNGRLLIRFDGDVPKVDIEERETEIMVTFYNTTLAEKLQRHIDVGDFATLVHSIKVYANDVDTFLLLSISHSYQQLSRQQENIFLLDIASSSEKEMSYIEDEVASNYATLSLNFQEIKVRSALQIIADLTHLNFIISDEVVGTLSLRLNEVPWEQALDAILKSKNLSMSRTTDNLVWIAPTEAIMERRQQELKAQRQKTELEPIVSEIIPLKYARAEQLMRIIKSVRSIALTTIPFDSKQEGAPSSQQNSLLTDRGSVEFDERTNILLIQDTASRVEEIKNLINQLDIPLKQVEIETRIVEAQDGFSKSIGARLGFTQIRHQTENSPLVGSGIEQIDTDRLENAVNIRQTEAGTNNNHALSVNLPASAIGSDPVGSYNFSISKLGGRFINLIDLELSALQAEGRGKVLANPKILTTDKRKASISQGQERLSVFNSAFGTASSEGQTATLGLTVLPQITPNNEIILDVQITNDSFVSATSNTVNTKRVDTQALLKDGETVVIGGIYMQKQTKSVTKVPVLGDIPYIRRLFRKQQSHNERSELLIFLTPRIIDSLPAMQ